MIAFGLNSRESMTPKEFEYEMQEILNRLESRDKNECYYTQEQSHMDMDDLMCDLLLELGYEDGVKIFKNAPKWYS